MRAALRCQIANAQRFEQLEAAPEATVIEEATTVARRTWHKQDFLRFFGVGDMQPGSVRFINTLSEVAPELKLWVATRRFDMVTQLAPRENVHVMLGLDATTRPEETNAVKRLIQRKRLHFFASWVQRQPKELIPPWVSVVFAEHRLKARANWTRTSPDTRTCRATIAGGTSHDNACTACRRCFTRPGG